MPEADPICHSGDAMRQNVKSILIRLTAEEYAHLKAISEETGLKIEPMIRQLIMGIQLRPRPPDEYASLLRELSAIGNNINQIAYWANATKGISNQQIQDAAALVQRAFILVKDNL